MLFRISTTWTFSPCMTTSFRPLPRGPSHLSVPFKLCMYTHFGSNLISNVCLFSWMWELSPRQSCIKLFCFSERHLAQNPFICDCHLKWLADYLHTNPIETSGARCTSPRRLANKRIGQIKSKKFRCSGNLLFPETFSLWQKQHWSCETYPEA